MTEHLKLRPGVVLDKCRMQRPMDFVYFVNQTGTRQWSHQIHVNALGIH
jgi:hypothetical protein